MVELRTGIAKVVVMSSEVRAGNAYIHVSKTRVRPGESFNVEIGCDIYSSGEHVVTFKLYARREGESTWRLIASDTRTHAGPTRASRSFLVSFKQEGVYELRGVIEVARPTPPGVSPPRTPPRQPRYWESYSP